MSEITKDREDEIAAMGKGEDTHSPGITYTEVEGFVATGVDPKTLGKDGE